MGASEIILILFVYLLLFGAKGMPALAQTLGKAVYQFRNAARDVQKEIMDSASEMQKQTNIKLDQIDLGLEDTPQAAPRAKTVTQEPSAEASPKTPTME